MTLIEQAKVFRESFGQELLSGFTRFGFLKLKLWNMQLGLIEEEAAEFLEAADEFEDDCQDTQKAINVLKELSDLVFVCYQFAAAYNLDLDEAMRRVFESNMSKLGNDGKPIYRVDGKVLKGDNYKPPYLDDLVHLIEKTDNDNQSR
tara:strand:+ start:337 stop:777 length:441 start_codon:yes stop_codon:yes gene_type:complete